MIGLIFFVVMLLCVVGACIKGGMPDYYIFAMLGISALYYIGWQLCCIYGILSRTKEAADKRDQTKEVFFMDLIKIFSKEGGSSDGRKEQKT